MKRHRVVVAEFHNGSDIGSIAKLERVDSKDNLIEHFTVAGASKSNDHGATCREAARRLRMLADRFDLLATSDCPTQVTEQDIVNFEPTSIIGRTTTDASIVAMRNGYELRIIEIDGEAVFGTANVVRNRINVREHRGRVSAISSIG